MLGPPGPRRVWLGLRNCNRRTDPQSRLRRPQASPGPYSSEPVPMPRGPQKALHQPRGRDRDPVPLCAISRFAPPLSPSSSPFKGLLQRPGPCLCGGCPVLLARLLPANWHTVESVPRVPAAGGACPPWHSPPPTPNTIPAAAEAATKGPRRPLCPIGVGGGGSLASPPHATLVEAVAALVALHNADEGPRLLASVPGACNGGVQQWVGERPVGLMAGVGLDGGERGYPPQRDALEGEGGGVTPKERWAMVREHKTRSAQSTERNVARQWPTRPEVGVTPHPTTSGRALVTSSNRPSNRFWGHLGGPFPSLPPPPPSWDPTQPLWHIPPFCGMTVSPANQPCAPMALQPVCACQKWPPGRFLDRCNPHLQS